MSLLIRNGRIVSPGADFVGDLHIVGEKIAAAGLGLTAPADQVVDATGKLVIPGGIDPHVHLDMEAGPGLVTADDFVSGSAAAAAGGTTTVIDFANQSVGHSLHEALEHWLSKARGRSLVDYGFHMTVTDMAPERLDELDEMVERGVSSFKVFMAYPGRLYTDDATRFRTFRRVGELGGLVLLHAESGLVIDELVAEAAASGRTEPIWHARTRPTALAGEAVHRSAIMAGLAGVPLYIVHMNCAEDLAELRAARSRGVEVLGEVCPQYLFLDEEALAAGGLQGARHICSPPLRPAHHQEPLWRGLLMGDILTTATDHAPFCDADKARGLHDFRAVPNGLPGIEHRMRLIWTGGVVRRGMSIQRFVEATSTAAARIFGLYPRKGTLAPGSDADVVVWDPDYAGVIERHHMATDFDPYQDMEVQGRPELVVRRGEVIARYGEPVGEGGGVFLERGDYGLR